MGQVASYAFDAVSQGAIDAVAALGIALIFGVLRLLNFAQTALVMIGGYVIYFAGGLPWWVAVMLSIVAVAALAVVTERVAFRPLRTASMTTLLVTSFALFYLIQNVVIMAQGGQTEGVSFGVGLLQSISIGTFQVAKYQVLTLLASAALLTATALFLKRTKIGLQVRAATENFGMARMLGVPANRVIMMTFAISGLLASAVSVLVVVQTGSVAPSFGLQQSIIGFIATVVGGMGSLTGAAAAGLVLGGASTVLQLLLPSGGSAYNQAIVLLLVVIFLALRPEGIAGGRLTGERL